jgi:hypothetical protein
MDWSNLTDMTRGESEAASAQTPLIERQRRQMLLLGFVHIVALNALAVAQPLLDLLGRQAEFFVAHGAHAADVVLFAVLMLIVLPAFVIGVDSIAWAIGPRTYAAVHATIVAIYVALLCAHILARFTDLPLALHLIVSVGIGVGAAIAYTRVVGVRSFATFLAPAPLAIGFLFLFGSAASGIVFPASVEGAVDGAESSDVDVVFVIFDELPLQTLLDDDGEIDDAFPAFARLAAKADWFRNATTLSDASHVAVPSILSGMEPEPGAGLLPVASDYPANLFTTMAPTHDVYASERITELCPASVCSSDRAGLFTRSRQMVVDSGVVFAHIVLPEGVRERLPDISSQWGAFVDVGATGELTSEAGLERKRFEGFVDALGSFEGPGLYFMHSILPHRPWVYSSDGTLYDEALVPGHDTTHPASWLGNEYLVSQGYERHRDQVQFADRLLGDVLDRLESAGLLDDSVVVVTADHGINFTPDEFDRTATLDTYDQILPIPLLIKASGQTEGSVNETPVEIVDILATTLDLAGLTWRDRTDGFSLYDSGYSPRTKRFFNAVEEVSINTNTIDLMGSRSEILAMVGRSGPVGAMGLIGQSVADLTLGGAAVDGTLRGLDRFGDIRFGEGSIPLHVFGGVEGPLPDDGVPLLLSVNGTIVASGKTYTDGQLAGQFSLLIPSSSLVDGSNHLRLFVLGADGTVAEVSLSGGVERGEALDYRLETDGQVSYLDNGSGNVIVLEGGWLKVGVEVDRLLGDGRRHISGWAFDQQNSRPVDSIIVFGSDGRFVASVAPHSDRPDVSDALSVSGIDPSGWVVDLPSMGSEDVRVVVVASGRATEITLP